MSERVIAELGQLSDAQLFKEAAIGIEHIINGVAVLDVAACALSRAGNEYLACILRTTTRVGPVAARAYVTFLQIQANANVKCN